MPFCQNCGSPVEGRFCPKCGAALAEPASTGSPEGGPAAPPPTASSGMSDNVAGALAYLLGFITGILFLVLEPYNRSKKVRFHAFQSIFLSVAVIIIHVVLSTLAPFTLGFTLVLSVLVSLGALILWLFMMWKTYQDQKIVLPVIGSLAEQQA
jgi:uncharacterized membrane protein